MSYTDQASLLRRIGAVQLAQLACDSETMVETLAEATTQLADPDVQAVVQQAIDDGESEINGYVIGHLDITDSANIAALERHNAYLALHNLYARAQNSSRENPYTEYRAQTLEWLLNVAKGRFHTQSSPEAPASGLYSTTATTTPTFRADTSGNDPMENFR